MSILVISVFPYPFPIYFGDFGDFNGDFNGDFGGFRFIVLPIRNVVCYSLSGERNETVQEPVTVT